MKRILSAVLAAALLVGSVPAALAADIDSHWSKPYVTSLHELGIINPSASTGNYTPEASVTRWEFMRYINRAFDFTEKQKQRKRLKWTQRKTLSEPRI